MRKLGVSALACSLAFLPYAALSQESVDVTPDDFVCALAGDCGDETQPQATGPNGARVNSTRGFALSRPGEARPAQKAAPPRQTQRQQSASGPRRPAQQAQQASQAPRVDLRLSFATGSSELAAADQARLRAFAEALTRPQLAETRIRIEGHTDSSGGRAINMTLSQRRAQAVADFLVSQGIAANRLEVRGLGYDRPLPGRPASAGENRRVEAVRIS